jgi:hypothetical protein
MSIASIIRNRPYGTSNIFLYGLPGVGKTETALKMAFAFIESEKYKTLKQQSKNINDHSDKILCFDFDNRIEGNEFYQNLPDDKKDKMHFINVSDINDYYDKKNNAKSSNSNNAIRKVSNSVDYLQPYIWVDFINDMSLQGYKYGVVIVDALNIMYSRFITELTIKNSKTAQLDWTGFYNQFGHVVSNINAKSAMAIYTSTAGNVATWDNVKKTYVAQENHFKSTFKVSKVKHVMDVIVQIVADKETNDKTLYIHQLPNGNIKAQDYKNAISHYKDVFAAGQKVDIMIEKIATNPFIPNKPVIDETKLLQQKENINNLINFEDVKEKVFSCYSECVQGKENEIYNISIYQSLLQQYHSKNTEGANLLRVNYDRIIKPILLGDGEQDGIIKENTKPYYFEIAKILSPAYNTDADFLLNVLRTSPVIQEWKDRKNILHSILLDLFTSSWKQNFDAFNTFINDYNPNDVVITEANNEAKK